MELGDGGKFVIGVMDDRLSEDAEEGRRSGAQDITRFVLLASWDQLLTRGNETFRGFRIAVKWELVNQVMAGKGRVSIKAN